MALLHETTAAIVRDWFCNRLNPCHVIIPVRRLRTSRCSSGYKLLCCKLGHELDLSRVRVIPPVSADPDHVLLPLVCFQLPGQQCCVQTHDVEISAPSRSTPCGLRDVRQSYERDTGSDQLCSPLVPLLLAYIHRQEPKIAVSVVETCCRIIGCSCQYMPPATSPQPQCRSQYLPISCNLHVVSWPPQNRLSLAYQGGTLTAVVPNVRECF